MNRNITIQFTARSVAILLAVPVAVVLLRRML